MKLRSKKVSDIDSMEYCLPLTPSIIHDYWSRKTSNFLKNKNVQMIEKKIERSI